MAADDLYKKLKLLHPKLKIGTAFETTLKQLKHLLDNVQIKPYEDTMDVSNIDKIFAKTYDEATTKASDEASQDSDERTPLYVMT